MFRAHDLGFSASELQMQACMLSGLGFKVEGCGVQGFRV